MNIVDIIVLGAVLAWLGAAVIHTVRKKRRGECIGCSECCPYKDGGKCSCSHCSSHIEN
ncbi:MAG: FeoB-associated Cys-rich membrane protein [Oscillospiraceae bacterium]|nr:FeoB-associated Cys-rich membrane protein [Oscillospiraceae bacterium]MDY2846946.1 FeoB-associated Cys-rich membrane protein [Oscillospiraceae bacterium]